MQARRLENHNGVDGRAQFERAGVEGLVSSAHQKTRGDAVTSDTVVYSSSIPFAASAVFVHHSLDFDFFARSFPEHHSNGMPIAM